MLHWPHFKGSLATHVWLGIEQLCAPRTLGDIGIQWGRKTASFLGPGNFHFGGSNRYKHKHMSCEAVRKGPGRSETGGNAGGEEGLGGAQVGGAAGWMVPVRSVSRTLCPQPPRPRQREGSRCGLPPGPRCPSTVPVLLSPLSSRPPSCAVPGTHPRAALGYPVLWGQQHSPPRGLRGPAWHGLWGAPPAQTHTRTHRHTQGHMWTHRHTQKHVDTHRHT